MKKKKNIVIDLDSTLTVCSEVGEVVAKLQEYIKIFKKSNENHKTNLEGKELRVA